MATLVAVMRRLLALLFGLTLLLAPRSANAAKPEPFTWQVSEWGIGSQINHPNGCLGEDSYVQVYGRGAVAGPVEFDLHLCDATDRADFASGGAGGAALVVRSGRLTNGSPLVPLTIYRPDGTSVTTTLFCLTFDPPFPDQGGGSGTPIPNGTYRVVMDGNTANKSAYGVIEVSMSYQSWVTGHCQAL